MFVQTEITPNPNSLKFLPGKDVSTQGSFEITKKDETNNELIRNLLSVNGVEGIFLGRDFISINKNDKILSGIGSATKKVEVYKNGNISSSLKDDIKKFVNNKGDVNGDGVFDNRPGSDMNSSDSPQEAVVSLQNAKKTKYKTYILVQNELTKAYNELRNEKSILEYGKEFGLLDSDKQNTIKNYYPMNISEADIKKEEDE